MTGLQITTGILVCFAIINIAAGAAAIADKKKAIKGHRRISEKTLMLLGLFGGALGEYITMLKIRHKTKHKKFMIGLPLQIFLHIILIFLIVYKVALNQ